MAQYAQKFKEKQHSQGKKWEIKSTISEMKFSLDRINSRLDTTE